MQQGIGALMGLASAAVDEFEETSEVVSVK
jgi:hypothetical protein